jgi:hypothetical protein
MYYSRSFTCGLYDLESIWKSLLRAYLRVCHDRNACIVDVFRRTYISNLFFLKLVLIISLW